MCVARYNLDQHPYDWGIIVYEEVNEKNWYK